jgi:putative ABC transport system permease protein
MNKVIKIAARNLLRYRRRTVLTTLLITIGVVAMLLFVSTSGSFKAMMVGQITDSMLGDLQIHKKGYVSSIDSLPLTMNMKPAMVEKAEDVLASTKNVEAWSPRIKLGAMFSNFAQTTSIRLNGVDPEKEMKTCPELIKRIIAGDSSTLVERGKILIPELIAKGLKVGPGDSVVLVATNKDGSVNGINFTIQGVLEGISGPGGRDGYMHIDDARELLRIGDGEISEIAVRLKQPEELAQTMRQLQNSLGKMTNQQGKPAFEIHDWTKLSPFSSIASMIDLMTLFIKIMLVAIVLISVMNVMIMAVYERIREIGTIAAMGTLPSNILKLFVMEGFLLGLLGAILGTLISVAVIVVLQHAELTFSFGRQADLTLHPLISIGDIAFASIMVVVVAVLASLQPAWKASRMNPIDALRHV